MNAGYLLALITGFLGGFGHCIGMCGPLVASSSLHSISGDGSRNPRGPLLNQSLYNLGRLTTYGLVGAIMGFAASFVDVAGRLMGIQNGVIVGAGIVMIVMGLGITGIVMGTGWLEQHNLLVLAMAKKMFGLSSRWRYYPLGLVLGLMPCGLSYTAFIAAAGTGSPVSGMLTMFFFGAGTVPALMLFGMMVAYFGSRTRAWMQKTGGLAVIVMGFYYILKGIRFYVEM
ncbi:MAG TPA: sulfite exporter TauE/SafE family protein [Nitrospirota bacterium]|nr:sulfite exporter TauE/SafE family protein [Nitrospirota bacterium]